LKYSQPDFFKFGNDSLFLVEKFLEYEKNNHGKNLQICDLCCGSGVIGLEILNIRKELSLTSVDILYEFKKYFHKNIENLGLSKLPYSFLNMSISEIRKLEYKNKFDYIVSNPPYYHPEKSRMPNNENTKITKFFIKDGFIEFVKTAHYCLNKNGVLWFLKTTKINNDVVDKKFINSYFLETHSFKMSGFELLRLVKLDEN
jgi:tRNA1Val (adenine37-N6)-methyltransferase